MAIDNIAGQIADLRASVENNRKLRNDAETQLALSKQRLNTIDQRLKEIGINPDNVDEELRDLESQFSVLSDNLKEELKKESDAYRTIIEQTKQAV